MKSQIPLHGIVVLPFLLACLALPVCAATDDAPHAIAARAFEMRMKGQTDQAIQLLEDSLDKTPEAGVLHFELARARLLLLDIDEMYREANAAVSHEPENNEFGYFAAMASAYALIDAAHHGDQDRMKELGRESLAHLDAILARDPEDCRARCFLVQLSTDMAPELGLQVEDPEKHVVLLEEKDPILGAKARCCLVDQVHQRELWDRILTDYPGDCRALSEAAEGLIQAGDLDLAEKCLDEVITKDSQMTYGLLGLGLAHFRRQDWARAEALTRRYLDTDPPLALKAYATGRLGMIHRQMGDKDRAKELGAASRELDPHVWQTVMPPPKEIFSPI